MVSLGLIYGFFRVHSGFHVGVSCQEFLSGFLWVSPRVFRASFRIQTGENEAKEKKKQRGSKDRKQRNKKTGSRAAKTHD